jgi:phage N-6-adenine-methyltransferase
MSLAVHFSTEKHDWATPPEFFAKLNDEFHFTLDAAASRENALCADYLGQETNALERDWPGVVWCNPPYGLALPKFVRKGYEESLKGSTVVFLIPARTDTKVWHDVIFPNAEIRFVPGRLKFSGHKNAAPFPCAVVIFRGKSMS